MIKPFRLAINKGALSIFFSICALEGVIAAFFIIQEPSETGQNLILGFSTQRVILLIGNVTLALFFLIIAIYLWQKPYFVQKIKPFLKKRRLLILSTLAGYFFISLAFLVPEYRFESITGYIERLRPVMVWFVLIFIQAAIFFLLTNKLKVSSSKSLHLPLAFLASFLLIWFFISSSGLGITPDDRHWNEAGVPLLNEQILIALLLSLTLFAAITTTRSTSLLAFIHKKQDSLLFVLLWAVTAFLWVSEPLPGNFFAPGPYPPSEQLFPYADTSAFDIGGQFALIGQGFFNSQFYARGLLSGFLAFLHILGGQNYLTVVTLQTAIFSSVAPVIYLIGKKLHGRVTGVFAAALIIVKGINAIASSTLILSSHPKYMLTELPTAIMLGLFTLWMIQWQKKENGTFLILAGGALGLGIMLRTNILFILIIVPILLLLKLKLNWKKIFQASLVFFFAFFFTISPWMWRNQAVANKPFFFLDILTEVIRTRYLAEPAEFGTDIQPAPEIRINSNSLSAIEPVLQKKAPYATPVKKHLLQKKLTEHSQANMLEFIPNHFFHNIVTSTLILPTSLQFHDLQHTIKDIFPYWNKTDLAHWDGQLNWGAKTLLFWNLFLLALGLSAAWKKWRFAGIIPLLVFLIYHLSNAFARTSGGRYLVPVDWVILLYYAMGIIEIIIFLATTLGFEPVLSGKKRLNKLTRAPSFYRKTFYILPFFLFVGSITVLEQVVPIRYPTLNKQEVITQVIDSGWLETTDISAEELTTFMQQSDSRAFLGRILYPRFYKKGKGEPMIFDAYEIKEYPRIAFTLIGPFGQTGVILPMLAPPFKFPNASDAIVIGCQHPRKTGIRYPYLDALLVIVLEESEVIVYSREPTTTLQCPTP